MLGIYKVSCIQESVVYIGSSKDIGRRWYDHKRNLRYEKHRNKNLQLAWDAYGEDSFIFEVVEETTELVKREQQWLDKFWPNCYNISPNAWNPMADASTIKKNIESLRKSGKRGNQKLKEYQVIEIKEHIRDKTLSIKELSDRYKVSVSQVRMIKRGERWGYIKVEGFVEGRDPIIKRDEPDIIKMYTEGYKVSEIKNKHSISSNSIIYDILTRNGVATDRTKNRTKTSD